VVSSQIKEFWVSAETAHFPLFVPIPIPFGNGKLAQERSAFAQKRNTTNFLIFAAESRLLMLRSINRVGLFPQASAHSDGEVPLDAAETKLEDCQRDIRKNLRGFLCDCFKLSQM
jgi:hypothetical protein